MRQIFFLLSFLCVITCPVFAASSVKTPDGFVLELSSPSVIVINKLKYFVFDLKFSNQSESKKVDFDRGVGYELSDEFGNLYRSLRKPDQYFAVADKLPPGFPAVYPSESCSATLFFEAPVAQTSLFKLKMSAPFFGAGAATVAFELPHPVLLPEQVSAWIDIAMPEDGAVFRVGDSFPLKVVINAKSLPKRLVIIAFNKTLDDAAPALDNEYTVKVPEGFTASQASVSVIGYWPSVGDGQVAAKNVIVHIQPAAQPF
jgi:hypothetical protein